MRSLEEVNQRLGKLKTDYVELLRVCDDDGLYYEYEGDLIGMYNQIRELEWVLRIDKK